MCGWASLSPIKLRGYPNRWVSARVKSIAPVAAAAGSEAEPVAGAGRTGECGRELESGDDGSRENSLRQTNDLRNSFAPRDSVAAY